MLDAIQELIIFVLQLMIIIIVHELGHLVLYWLFKYPANITFKDGLIIAGDNVVDKVKLWQFLIIAWSGIIAGLLPMYYFLMPKYMFTLYALLICFDIVSILVVMKGIKKYHYNITIGELNYNESLEIVLKK